MPREVNENAKYGDVCFCKSSDTCDLKTCFRHMCHAAYPEWMAVAELEGDPHYCLKEARKKEK